MRRLKRESGSQLPTHQEIRGRRQRARPLTVKPYLETLEDRLTPSFTPATVTGSVFLAASSQGFSGATVTLQGTVHDTGKTIDLTTTSQANGNFQFTQVQQGSYTLSINPGLEFQGGKSTTSLTVGSTGTVSENHVTTAVSGLKAQFVSLVDFLSEFSGSLIPAAGAGVVAAFSLDSASPLASTMTVADTPATPTYVDLANNFFDPATSDTTVDFNTPQGTITVQLDDTDAPVTVTNFLDEIAAGDLNDTLFSRESALTEISGTSNFALTPQQVLQGGGIKFTPGTLGTSSFSTPTPFQPIKLEASLTNTEGTLAMASTSKGVGITNQFFFNLTNNSGSSGGLDGSFSVFGHVTGFTPTGGTLSSGADSLTTGYSTLFTAENLNGDTATNLSTVSGVGDSAVPLVAGNGYTPTTTLSGASDTNLAEITSVTVPTAPTGQLTYTVMSSKPGVVTATLGKNTSTSTFSANQLQLTPVMKGTSVITVQATDKAGESVVETFTVTVP